MLKLEQKWVWDFWFAQQGEQVHIFYLQASRTPDDPELRHWNVSVGHGVSDDLVNWRILPDALHPAPAETDAFDSYTTWTGSIIEQGGTWYMFYTGGKRSEDGLVQRIGLATSPDLMTWTKHADNPVMVADPTHYELLDRTKWHDQAWRDPYVFEHPETGVYHALITARANTGKADERGVIGHAVSDDLLNWQVKAPIFAPGKFGHLEVPQWAYIQGRYYLLFSCPPDKQAAAFIATQSQVASVYCASSANPLGPFDMHLPGLSLSQNGVGLYSAKMIQHKGQWYVLGFLDYTASGEFIGTISDPLPLHTTADGALDVRRV